MLRMIGYGENMGSGFPLILSAWNEKHWVKPELIEQPELLQVKLKLSVMNTDATEEGGQKTSQKIIELIRNNPHISTQEMADIIGIDRRNITRNLRGLYDRNILRRVDPDKGGHLEIIE